jgi:DNA-directed RNA polymerase specialized sigma24 family protein
MNQPFFAEATAWSTVMAARGADEDARLAALERLFARYRRPICLEFQARKRCAEDEAEESAQQFIHDCLRRDFLRAVDPSKGRFRTFIQACVTNFIRDERDKATAAKRGGGQEAQSLDETDEEGRRLIDPSVQSEPLEITLDRHWAHHLVSLAMERLEGECVAARRRVVFTTLRPFLQTDPENGTYAAVALKLGMKEGAVRTATSRLRQRFRELLEEEIRATTGTDGDWREELRYFLEVLGSAPSVTADGKSLL